MTEKKSFILQNILNRGKTALQNIVGKRDSEKEIRYGIILFAQNILETMGNKELSDAFKIEANLRIPELANKKHKEVLSALRKIVQEKMTELNEKKSEPETESEWQSEQEFKEIKESAKRTIICSNCGKEKPHNAKGLCKACYMALLRKKKRIESGLPVKIARPENPAIQDLIKTAKEDIRKHFDGEIELLPSITDYQKSTGLSRESIKWHLKSKLDALEKEYRASQRYKHKKKKIVEPKKTVIKEAFVCPNCNRQIKHYGLGFCRQCYNQIPRVKSIKRKRYMLKRLPEDSRKRYYFTEEWQERKRQRMEETNRTCQLCGAHFEHSAWSNLSLHHLNYDNFRNEKPEDLILVCRPCHAAIHGKKD